MEKTRSSQYSPYSTLNTERAELSGTEIHAAQPSTQGMNPLLHETHGVNSQLQMVHAPINTRAHGFQMSTTVISATTNPLYGIPIYPQVEGIKLNTQSHVKNGPPYLRGLIPIPERDFLGPYTKYVERSCEEDLC